MDDSGSGLSSAGFGPSDGFCWVLESGSARRSDGSSSVRGFLLFSDTVLTKRDELMMMMVMMKIAATASFMTFGVM